MVLPVRPARTGGTSSALHHTIPCWHDAFHAPTYAVRLRTPSSRTRTHAMATTDAKPGFRLPWSADRGDAATPAEPDATAPTDTTVEPTPPDEVETPAMIDAPASETSPEAAAPTPVATAPSAATTGAPSPVAATPTAPAPAPRKTNKLMADLTRAMQGAAEQARTEALARLGSDSKAF